MVVRNIEVICRHVAGLGTLNGLTVEEEEAFERHVRASGLTVAEWIRREAGRGRPKQVTTNSSEAIIAPKTRARDARSAVGQIAEAAALDLDYWADEPPEPDDDDDGDMVPCPVCGGRGKDAAGNTCAACKGTGQVRENEEDEDEDEE
jgi:hypothetical protein